jgi:hypothetical protein
VNFFINFLLVVGVVLLGYGYWQRRTNPHGSGQLLLLLATGLLVVMVIVKAVVAFTRDPAAEVVRGLEAGRLHTLEVKMQGLGQYLAEQVPNKRVLLITSATLDEGEAKIIERGLRQGLGKAVAIVAEWKPAKTGDYSVGEMGTGYMAAPVDQALAQHRDVEVVLSLIGLPPDYKQLESFRPYYATGAPNAGPAWIIMNAIDYVPELEGLIRGGYLQSAILVRRGVEGKPATSQEPRAIFENLCLPVNAQTPVPSFR